MHGVHAHLAVGQILGHCGLERAESVQGFLSHLDAIQMLAGLRRFHDLVVQIAPGDDDLFDLAQQPPVFVVGSRVFQKLEVCRVVLTKRQHLLCFLANMSGTDQVAHAQR